MENKDEQIIIKRILEGETAIFSHFVEQYSHSVYSMIVRIVQSREDAEELSQDAFLKAFSKLETFKGDCSFSTWLFRIAYNTGISFVSLLLVLACIYILKVYFALVLVYPKFNLHLHHCRF